MKNIKNSWLFTLVGLLGLVISGCADDPIPAAIRESTNDYIGEWRGQDNVRVEPSGNTTTTTLPEILSLRNESGKDTFNVKNATTGAVIAGRSGTWSVIRVEGQDGEPTNRLLRLGVRSAGRITYSTFVVQEASAANLTLVDGYGNNSRDLRTFKYKK